MLELHLNWGCDEMDKLTITNPNGDVLVFISGDNRFGLLSISDFGNVGMVLNKKQGYQQRGNTVIQKRYDSRVMALTLFVSGETEAVFQRRIKQVSRFFEGEYIGGDDLTPFNLNFEINGNAKSGEAFMQATPIMRRNSDNYDARFQKFMVTFMMPDPIFYDEEYTETVFSSLLETFEFPLEISDEFEFGIIYEDGFPITNVGDIGVPIIVTFDGLSTNPVLENVTYGEKLKLNKTIAAGDSVLIDTSYENPRVLITESGVESNAFNIIDTTYNDLNMKLRRGINVLKYSSDDASASSATLYFKNGWMSLYSNGWEAGEEYEVIE